MVYKRTAACLTSLESCVNLRILLIWCDKVEIFTAFFLFVFVCFPLDTAGHHVCLLLETLFLKKAVFTCFRMFSIFQAMKNVPVQYLSPFTSILEINYSTLLSDL